MFTLSRTITLLAICALAAAAFVPAATAAERSPAAETYVLDDVEAGNGGAGGSGQDSQGGSGDGAGVPAAAADSADEGGLPILLIVLVGTAAVGAGIAILRRRTPTS